jgi:hypothetical protein
MVGSLMNAGLESIWKETVVLYGDNIPAFAKND